MYVFFIVYRMPYETSVLIHFNIADSRAAEYFLGNFVIEAFPFDKDVHQLSKEMESEFPKMEKSLSRLIKFLEIMKDNNLIYWKGEEKK